MKTGFTAEAEQQRSLGCTFPGCRNAWTCDVSHGRLCSEHDAQMAHSRGGKPPADVPKRQAAMPLREAMRPFTEPVDHEEYVHDEPVSF